MTLEHSVKKFLAVSLYGQPWIYYLYPIPNIRITYKFPSDTSRIWFVPYKGACRYRQRQNRTKKKNTSRGERAPATL